MIKSLDFLLDQNFKKQLLKFLDEACPPKNAFYKTATLEFLGKLAQIILNNKIINDKRQLIALNDVFIEYYSGHVGIYRVKLYQKEASLSKIMDELVFLLESIF